MASTASTPRRTAAERRQAILEAAVVEVAVSGFASATTAGIARRAGISQPYVFRFFPTKKALALAVIDHAFAKIVREWEAAVPAPGETRLRTLGRTYVDSIGERRAELLVQIQAYAAASDPDIAAALRACLARVIRYVADLLRRDGHDDPDSEAVRFVSRGFLINAAMAVGLETELTAEEWAAICPRSGVARVDDMPRLGAPKS
jgi:AcrR family transcriptional regulator